MADGGDAGDHARVARLVRQAEAGPAHVRAAIEAVLVARRAEELERKRNERQRLVDDLALVLEAVVVRQEIGLALVVRRVEGRGENAEVLASGPRPRAPGPGMMRLATAAMVGEG